MRPAVVAIPARDEADRIAACLAALALQRDDAGAPLPEGAFHIIVYANNCRDHTCAVAERVAATCAHPLTVVAETTSREKANAGWARKRAMDLAACHLEREDQRDGAILTTDADTCVSPTWVAATMRAFDGGVDGVAGYVDPQPAELLALGPAFLRRSRLEDRYLRAIAEIHALCDPRPHDPWPTHRASAGASLAVTLLAYRAIGGLPPVPVGEDAALTRTLEREGFTVRHAMDVVVATSCRLEGRVPGGAAATMHDRLKNPEAPCDADMDRASAIFRRARIKGRLRRAKEQGKPLGPDWGHRIGVDATTAANLIALLPHLPFERCWEHVVAESPVLRAGAALRPADLPDEIARAEAILARLRRPVQPRISRSSRYVPVAKLAAS